jgi:hypothetical protein
MSNLDCILTRQHCQSRFFSKHYQMIILNISFCRCKSMADLKKHSETHNTEGPYKCEFLDCQYKAKHYKRLEGHYSRMHQVKFIFLQVS